MIFRKHLWSNSMFSSQCCPLWLYLTACCLYPVGCISWLKTVLYTEFAGKWILELPIKINTAQQPWSYKRTKVLMSFSPCSLCFVVPQTSPPPPPRWSGCKSLLFCSFRGCVHSLLSFHLTSDDPECRHRLRSISFKSQTPPISSYFQFAGVLTVCGFYVQKCSNVPNRFPWKWSPSTQAKSDSQHRASIHPSIHQLVHQTYQWTICQPPPAPSRSPAATSQEEAPSWGLMC